MIAWLNANSGAISATASVISALTATVIMYATIVYARYTWQLTVENRLLRKAGTEPEVVAYAIINPRVFGAIDFIITNIGRGAARNVSYKIVSGGEDLNAKDVRLPRPEMKFAFLPQDEQISTFMGMGWDLLGEPRLGPFEVEVEYANITGEPRTGRFKIDIAQFDGLHRVGKPADEEIADAVKKIAKVMEDWSRQRLPVETITTSERQERDRQRREEMQQRRAAQNQSPSSS